MNILTRNIAKAMIAFYRHLFYTGKIKPETFVNAYIKLSKGV